jgi:hypothetical protein
MPGAAYRINQSTNQLTNQSTNQPKAIPAMSQGNPICGGQAQLTACIFSNPAAPNVNHSRRLPQAFPKSHRF